MWKMTNNRLWIEIGDAIINTDHVAFVKRVSQGCTFHMTNGVVLNAEGADFDQVKGLLGFAIDGEQAAEN